MSSIKYVPAVKVAVFTLSQEHKIGPAIVERVVVYVVYLHPVRGVEDEPVHTDGKYFTASLTAGYGVEA